MASIYTVMVTRKNESDDEYKNKFFTFLNKKTAAKAMRKLIGEMEAIIGEKPYKMSYANTTTYFYASDERYYSVSCTKNNVSDLTDESISLNFTDNKD